MKRFCATVSKAVPLRKALPRKAVDYCINYGGRRLRVSALQPSEAEEAASFIAKVFKSDEPVMGPLFSLDELAGMFVDSFKKNPNLAAVIRDGKEIVGSMICDRAPRKASEFPPFLMEKKFAPFLETLKMCEREYLEYHAKSKYPERRCATSPAR